MNWFWYTDIGSHQYILFQRYVPALQNIFYNYRLNTQVNEGWVNDMNTLSLKAPITTAADDKFCDTFPNFRQK